MTLLGFWGFDAAATLKYPEWDNVFPTAATGRDGVAGHAGQVNGAFTKRSLTPPGGAIGTVNLGFATYYASAAAGKTTWTIPVFGTASGVAASLCVDGNSRLVWREGDGGTILQTSSGLPLVNGTWHHIQVKFIPHLTNGRLLVKQDGITVIDVTGVKTSNYTANISYMGFGDGAGSATNSIFDDMYLCDGTDATATQGRAFNDLLGDLKVQHHLPTAAGDTTELTSSSGANYTAVDDPSSAVNTTDIVSATPPGSGQLRDLYNIEDAVGNASLVYAVRPYLYASKNDAGAAFVRTAIKENGIVTPSASLPLTTSYALTQGPLYTKKPSNGAVFSVADLNALQIGADAVAS